MPSKSSLPLLTCLTLVALLLSGASLSAEPLRIGVVLPGRASTTSANWNEVLSARAWASSVQEGSAGMSVSLSFRDGGTTPANTTSALRELLEEGMHAIVCCVTPVSASAAAAFAAELPIISMVAPNRVEADERSPLIIEAGPRAHARAMAYDARRFVAGVGLMTLDNAFGRTVTTAVVSGLEDAGLRLTRVETYSPQASVLTPEGLLVAASQPGAVIVWGLPRDSVLALDALRARGYEGPVYLPWHLAAEFPGGTRSTRLQDARLTAPPSELKDALPEEHFSSGPAERYRRLLAEAYGPYSPTTQGAKAYDALELLLDAAELALVYGVDPAATSRFRQAMYDALVAVGPVDGAAGRYDYDGDDPELALAEGLIIATPVEGRLQVISR